MRRWPYLVALAGTVALTLLFLAAPAEHAPRGDIVPASTTPPIVRSVP